MQDIQSSWPNGVKKTKQRVCVLSVLEHSDLPMSAMDIYQAIEKEDSPVWLSTVYRILELFVQKGLVLKTTVLDNDMAIYQLNRNQHKHYAICLSCHKVIEMDNCPMETFTPQLADQDFRVLGHKVEMYGYCKDCDRKK